MEEGLVRSKIDFLEEIFNPKNYIEMEGFNPDKKIHYFRLARFIDDEIEELKMNSKEELFRISKILFDPGEDKGFKQTKEGRLDNIARYKVRSHTYSEIDFPEGR